MQQIRHYHSVLMALGSAPGFFQGDFSSNRNRNPGFREMNYRNVLETQINDRDEPVPPFSPHFPGSVFLPRLSWKTVWENAILPTTLALLVRNCAQDHINHFNGNCVMQWTLQVHLLLTLWHDVDVVGDENKPRAPGDVGIDGRGDHGKAGNGLVVGGAGVIATLVVHVGKKAAENYTNWQADDFEKEALRGLLQEKEDEGVAAPRGKAKAKAKGKAKAKAKGKAKVGSYSVKGAPLKVSLTLLILLIRSLNG